MEIIRDNLSNAVDSRSAAVLRAFRVWKANGANTCALWIMNFEGVGVFALID